MTRKFLSFDELKKDFIERAGTAIEYADEDDTLREVSYAELAGMIESEVLEARAECRTVEIIRAENTLDTVVSLFANVIAGCDVIMTDILMADEAADKAIMAAEELRSSKLMTRDSRGRIKTAKREGEILFFTSGTTSSSKIVRLTSASLCGSAWSGQCMLACGKDDRILSVLPLSHVFGLVCGLLWGMAYGAVICLGRGVRRMVEDPLFFRPTIIPIVPSVISAMIRFETLNPELRTVLIGAAPCGAEVYDALREKGIDTYFGYGLTETSSGIAITQDLDEPEALYPCPGADIRIEPGGEVTVATPFMMQGYIGAVPMFDKDRFFTGDIGYLDDKGRLHLKGRKKDVIIMPDGTKIFCPEYEEDLAEMTGCGDIAVISRGGRAVLVAGQGSDIPSLKRAVEIYNSERLRSQQLYDIIEADSDLPRTATGKLRRYEIQERYGQ